MHAIHHDSPRAYVGTPTWFSLGLIWLTTMMAQVWAKGFRDDILRRVQCFTLFWHALDIIWVALFTTVYLLGKSP